MREARGQSSVGSEAVGQHAEHDARQPPAASCSARKATRARSRTHRGLFGIEDVFPVVQHVALVGGGVLNG